MATDINIAGRLHSMATGNVVAGANEILDDSIGKKQSVINEELYVIAGRQNDKQYDPSGFSGLGKVYLEKNIVNVGGTYRNILTQDAFFKDDGEGGRVPNTNTVFVVDYDFSIGTSETHNLTILRSSNVIMTSPKRMLVLTGETDDDNDVFKTEINGVTYYYKPIELAPYRTFSLMDTYEWYEGSTTNISSNPCVLLEKVGDNYNVLSNRSITATSDRITIYVAVTEQGYYHKSYTISVPYYYATVTPPAGSRIEILDFSKCVFLTANRDNISFDTTYESNGMFHVFDGETSVYIAAASVPDVFQSQNPAMSITIENAYRITTDSAITIPEDSVLLFNGGSIKDGSIIGTDTQLYADETPIFTNVIFNGSWQCPKIYSKWFSESGTIDNIIKQIRKLESKNCYNDIFVSKGDYWLTPNLRTPDNILFSVVGPATLHLFGNIRVRDNNVSYRAVGVFESHDVLITGGDYTVRNVDTVPPYKETLITGGTIYGDKHGHIYPDWNTYPEGQFKTYYNSNNDTSYETHDLNHTQTDSTYEGSHCLLVMRCFNISIDGIHCFDALGDGIDVEDAKPSGYTKAEPNTGFITIKNCTIFNTRRQGISAVTDHLNIENVTIEKVFGTAPCAGIDVEPVHDNVNNRCINIRDIIIKDTIIGIEVWTPSFQQTGILNIRNVRTTSVGFPLATQGNGFNVEIENCFFSATSRRGFVLDKTLGILRWSNSSNRFSSLKDMYATIKNCYFGVSDYSGDRYLLDCVSGNNSVSDKLYVDIDGCLFNASSTNGIRYARGFTLRNSRVYAKSITCIANTSSTNSANFIENCLLDVKILSLLDTSVSNNTIYIAGPILGGSLSSNRIYFQDLPANYKTAYYDVLPDLTVPSFIGIEKFLISVYQTCNIEGNRIVVNTDNGLNGLFFVSSKGSNRGAYAVIHDNVLLSSTLENHGSYMALRKIPIAIEGNLAPGDSSTLYFGAYLYNNYFENYKLLETEFGTNSEVYKTSSKVNGCMTYTAPNGKTVYACSYLITNLSATTDYVIEYTGVKPDGIIFEPMGGGALQFIPWGMEYYTPKATSALRLYWADGCHLDGTVNVYTKNKEIVLREESEGWQYTPDTPIEVKTVVSSNNTFTSASGLTKADCATALGITENDIDDIFAGETKAIRYRDICIANITLAEGSNKFTFIGYYYTDETTYGYSTLSVEENETYAITIPYVEPEPEPEPNEETPTE